MQQTGKDKQKLPGVIIRKFSFANLVVKRQFTLLRCGRNLFPCIRFNENLGGSPILNIYFSNFAGLCTDEFRCKLSRCVLK